jgi:hypothetical protein
MTHCATVAFTVRVVVKPAPISIIAELANAQGR